MKGREKKGWGGKKGGGHVKGERWARSEIWIRENEWKGKKGLRIIERGSQTCWIGKTQAGERDIGENSGNMPNLARFGESEERRFQYEGEKRKRS